MISTRARQTLAALLLALHATLSLCGPGHHALPLVGSIAAGESRSTNRDALADSLSAATDGHCPVCDYLANAVALPTPADPAVALRVEPAPETPRAKVAPAPSPRLARPRAPPLLVAR